MPSDHTMQVISVTGGKGGVGKTSTSINLAVSIAQQGKKVLLFDADLGLSNIDVLLGLKPKKNISHVLAGECTLNETIVYGPSGIQIIPAASGIQRMADLSTTELGCLIQAFSELTETIDVMLVDTAAGISNQVMCFVRACQENIIVVCNEPSSITDAYALIKVLNQKHNHNHFRVLANMTRNNRDGLEMFYKLKNATDQFLDITLSYLGAIPFDDQLRNAILNQAAVVDKYPTSKASTAFKLLANKVTSLNCRPETKGHITFFLERLLEFQQSEYAL